MTTYLVESYVTKLDEPGRQALVAAARAAADSLRREGFPVSYLGSIFAPGDEMCLHLFEATSADLIRRASRRWALSCERIVEVVESRDPPTNRKEPHMAQYVVDRHLTGFPPEQLPAAARAAKQTSAELSREGVEVRYVRSTWVPDGERCYCLFEGPSREAVEEVQRRASLPYEQIREAVFLSAEDV